MMMDLEAVLEKKHEQSMGKELVVYPKMIQSAIEVEKKREEEEKRRLFVLNFNNMSLLDIYSFGMISEIRRKVIRELKKREQKIRI